MKKTILITLVISCVFAPLFASYGIVTPSYPEMPYSILAENGEIIALDDMVWSKNWEGLRLEQTDGVYEVKEKNGSTTMIVTDLADDSSLYLTLGLSDATTLVTSGWIPEDRDLERSDIRAIVIIGRVDEVFERILENKGYDVYSFRPGSVIDIENGYPEIEDEGDYYVVKCPNCGEMITVRI